MRAFRPIGILLVALAALHFTLVGASAAGVFDTPAGVASLAELARREPPDRSPASIQITPSPITLDCNGVQSSLVTVRLTDARGKTVENGTEVFFDAADADLEVLRSETRKGEASARVTPFPFAGSVLVTILAGELEASIVIRCRPAPPCAPMSPPQHPMSPPCEPPPGCTNAFSPPQAFSPPCENPSGCPFSPPQHPMSPPCPTPTPDPCTNAFSPPQAFSPPCEDPPGCPFSPPQHPMSPPCPTPTPEPCDGIDCDRFTVDLDCDRFLAGIQQDCRYAFDHDVPVRFSVVLTNQGLDDVDIAAFTLKVRASSTSVLAPPSGADANLNANPDFNEIELPGSWACTPPAPSNDTGEGGPDIAVSFLSCFTLDGSGVHFPPGEGLRVATVSYELVEGAPTAGAEVEFITTEFAFTNNAGDEVARCGVGIRCSESNVTLGGLPPLYYALDCDTAADGVQDDCTLVAGATSVDVAVVAVNDETTAEFICGSEVPCQQQMTSMQFEVHNPSTSSLSPPPSANQNLDGNPDFNQAGIPGNWTCEFVPPRSDTGADGSGTSVSTIGCFTGLGGTTPVAIPEGTSLVLGTVYFDLVDGSAGGVTLTLEGVVAGDQYGRELGSCSAVAEKPTLCLPATIRRFTSEIVACIDFESECELPTLTPVASATPTPAAERLSAMCPDIDGDGSVTQADVDLVVANVRARGAEAAPYDVNRDGRVSVVDVLVVAARVGRPCS